MSIARTPETANRTKLPPDRGGTLAEERLVRWYELVAIERRLFSLEQYTGRHAPRPDTPQFWRFCRKIKGVLRRIFARRPSIDTEDNWNVARSHLLLTAWRRGR